MKIQNGNGYGTVTIGQGKPPRYIRNNHRVRTRFEEKGVGLLSSGSYACPVINVRAARKLIGVKPPKSGRKMFASIHSALGELIRPVKVADNGLFAVGNAVMSAEIFPPKNFQLLSQSQLVKRLKDEGQPLRVKHQKDGKVFEGMCLGIVGRPYASLVYTSQGKLGICDVETKKNSHNEHVVVRPLKSKEDRSKLVRQLNLVQHQTIKLPRE